MKNEQDSSNSAIVDSASDDFFDQLEAEVNGQVTDSIPQNTTESTKEQSGSEQVTHEQSTANVGAIDWDSEDNPYKKRYGDSSREAQKMKGQLDDLKPFMPVLDVMKQDSGLVEHVRQYLLGGGTPAKSVQDELGVGPDFQYNEQDALTNPNSDSAKVLNSHVDKLVQSRVGKMIEGEKAKSMESQKNLERSQQEKEFKAKYGMAFQRFTAGPHLNN